MNLLPFLFLVLAVIIAPKQIKRSVIAAWNIANGWTRLGLAIIIAWPVVLLIVALAGDRFLTSCLALMPLAATLIFASTFRDPLAVFAPEIAGGVGVPTLEALGSGARRWIPTIIGGELLWGIYLTLVPVWNDKRLLPFFFLVVGALFLLSIGVQGGLASLAKGMLTLFVLAITAIFFLGGRAEAEAKVLDWGKAVLTPKPKPPVVVAPIESRDFIEDGERIKLIFPPGRDFAEVAMPLSTMGWSKWIDASAGASAWIESVEKAGYTILFKDGHRHQVGPNDQPNFGEHIPIFKAMGTVAGQWLKTTAFQR